MNKKFALFSLVSLILLSYPSFANVAPDAITNGGAKDSHLTNVQSAPGTPQTVAVTVQGNASAVPVPVSGTVTAANPSVGTIGAAAPTSATYIGGLVGANLQGVKIFDLDTSGTTHEYSLGANLRFTGSGGSVQAATATNPLRVDPTGTTTQPAQLVAGTAIVGKVGIDQTTPGTTNGVVINSGTVTASPVSVSSTTITRVSNATSSTSILASNASRKGAVFYNDDTSSICKVAFAGTASATIFTVILQPGSHYEMPNTPLYTGAVAAICSLATGAIEATEL